MAKKHRDETILNHDTYKDQHGAVVPPLYQNSLFTFDSWDDIDAAFDNKYGSYIYTRLLNPTVHVAEKKIAALCGGGKAKLCGSGMAAISSAILHCVKANDHLITIKNIYGPANTFISGYLADKMNIETTYVDGRNPEEFEAAIQDNTTLIYLESPASLTMDIQDLKTITLIAKAHNIKTVIDNTWASPVFQKPLTMGVDIEVHSASKYLGGHSDVIAGVIISNDKTLDEILGREHELLGAKVAPFEGWLILRSLRTLTIRMKAIMENTMTIAHFLESHAQVRRVHYPGLESFSQHALAREQMTGFSGLLSFELDTDNISEIKAFVDALELFSLGVSWGGHDSLVYAPVISYLKELSLDQFAAMGITPSLIRLSIGLEHTEDLMGDLENAFEKMADVGCGYT